MISFHPLVRRDVSQAIDYYDSIGDSLGNEFWAEFTKLCESVESHPERFHKDVSGWRRANLKRFPYHLLFLPARPGIRIMILRHNRRHPKSGLRRK